MKINIILPNIGISGGNKIVFELANRLKNLHYDVVIYYPLFPYKFNRVLYNPQDTARISKDIITNLIQTKVTWFPVQCSVIKVPYISDAFLRDADISIATAWPTAFSVAKLDGRKGKKVYFIQHYEIWSGPKELVDKSYTLHLINVTTCNWIVKKIKEECGASIKKIIPCGIDIPFFKDHKYKNQKNKVLLLYDPLPWKGFDDGLEAFRIAKKKIPPLELVIFGKKVVNIPECSTFYYQPKLEIIRQLYAEAGVFLSPSHCEGFQLPPLEAMATGCPLISTTAGAIPEYAKNNISALLHEPRDIEGMAKSIVTLYENASLRKKLIANADKAVQPYSWDNVILLWKEFLKEVDKQ